MRAPPIPAIALAVGLFACLPLAGCTGSRPLPPPALALNAAGAEALAAGDLETAEARLTVALEYEPRFVEALTNLGLVELARGNLPRARQLCERAVRLNPDIAQPHHALGVLAEREGRLAAAAEHYRGALAVDPGFIPARSNLGKLYFEAGRFEHARAELRRVTELRPGDPRGWSGLVETLLQLGREDEADSILREAGLRFPADRRLGLLEARRLLRHEEWEPARQRLGQLATPIDELTPAILAWRAVLLLSQGQSQAAALAAREALKLDDQDPVATGVLAQALERLGDPEQSRWRMRVRQLRARP